MSAATRFDAPLLLGRVVKHPMSLIEDTFDAVPFDRGIREGFLEILGAMTPAQVEELFLAIEALNISVSDEFHDRVNQVYLQELEAVASTKDLAAENPVSYRDATSSIEM